MTITSTRRSVRSLGRMTQAQAAAWWAVHGSDVYRSGATTAERQERAAMDAAGDFRPQQVRGGVQELSDISVTGTLEHHISGDGWGQLGGFVPLDTHERSVYRSHPDRVTFERRVAGRQARDRRQARLARQAVEQGARQTRQRASDSGRLSIASGELVATDAQRYDETRPMVQRGRVHLTTVPESFAQVGARHGYEVSAPIDQDIREAGRTARRTAQSQMTRFGRLLPDAPILGQPIPRAMWFDRARGSIRSARGRTMALADAFPVDPDGDMCSEDMVADTSMVEMIDLEDLQQLLRSQGVTDREMEALEERAAGVAQSDRSGAALRRARERAGRIYTQWQRLEYCFAWSAV